MVDMPRQLQSNNGKLDAHASLGFSPALNLSAAAIRRGVGGPTVATRYDGAVSCELQ
jgi:hypothetical protein